MVEEKKKRKKEKHQDGFGNGKEERKKQGYFVPTPVLTPNTLVSC